MSTANLANPPAEPGTTHDQPTEDARLHAHQRRAFHLHASVFGVSMVLIFVVNLAINAAAGITGEWWAWWSVVAMLGWGLGVTVHGLVVRMSRPQSADSA